MFQCMRNSFLDCYLDSTVGSLLCAPPGKGITHTYTAEEYSDEFFALDDDAIESRVIDEIRKYTPSIPAKPILTRVYRWGRAVCLPHGGMMRELQAFHDGSFPGARGLFLAGEHLHPFASVNGPSPAEWTPPGKRRGSSNAAMREDTIRAASAELGASLTGLPGSVTSAGPAGCACIAPVGP